MRISNLTLPSAAQPNATLPHAKLPNLTLAVLISTVLASTAPSTIAVARADEPAPAPAAPAEPAPAPAVPAAPAEPAPVPAQPAPVQPAPVAAPADATAAAAEAARLEAERAEAAKKAAEAEAEAARLVEETKAAQAAKKAADEKKAADDAAVAASSEATKGPSLFEGTSLIYRNVASAYTFSKSVDPTWNPYYAQALILAPRVNLGKKFYLAGSLFVFREITEADSNTYANETTFSDTLLTVGYRAFKFESLGLGINFDAQLAVPTSKGSRMRTMYAGTGLGMSTAWSKGPFRVAWISRATRYWNKYTTGELEKPWLSGCTVGAACDPFVNTGVRNTEYRWLNIGTVSWQATKKFSVTVLGGEFADWLYALHGTTLTDGTTVNPRADNVSFRALMYWNINLEYELVDGFAVATGLETFNSQLAPNSTYQTPYFNRNAGVYLDIAIDPGRFFK